jgi:hypothetical protein
MHTSARTGAGKRHCRSGSITGSSPPTTVPASPIGALPDAASFAFAPFTKAFECMSLETVRPVGGSSMIKSQSAPALSALDGLTDVAACLASPPDDIETEGHVLSSTIGDKRLRDTQEFVRYYAEMRRRRFQRMLEGIKIRPA